jgi:serine/threonine protein kinase
MTVSDLDEDPQLIVVDKREGVHDKSASGYRAPEDCTVEFEESHSGDPAARSVSEYVKNFDGMPVIRILGRGSLGTVRLVEDPETRMRLAVKKFHEPTIPDLDIGEKFTQEIDILISFRHQCILPIVGYWLPTRLSPGQLATKFAANGSLRSVLDQIQKGSRPSFMDDTGVAIIVSGLTYGLRFLHSKNVIHRNLKPENVLIDEKGRPLIGDFGLSRLADLNVTQTKGIGAPHYMAPEMHESDDYTTAVDVFSFAMIVYEVIVGRPVFPPRMGPMTVMEKIKTGERPDIPRTVDGVARKIISWSWSPNPDLRPTMDEVVYLLQGIQFRLTEGVDIDRVSAFVAGISE